MNKITKLPAFQEDRLETGAYQFGDDWPLYVIRGDNMFGFLMYLNNVLESAPDSLYKMLVKSTVNSFSDCLLNRMDEHFKVENQINKDKWANVIAIVKNQSCDGCHNGDVMVNNIHRKDYPEDVANILFPCTSENIVKLLESLTPFVTK
jgi:hypothetical protein